MTGRGRSWVAVRLELPYLPILCLICFLVTGCWKSVFDLMGVSDLVCLTCGVVPSGSGVAQVISTVLIYPVAPMDRPSSTPQGRVVFQSFIPLLQFLVQFVTMIPTLITAVPVRSLAPSGSALADCSGGFGQWPDYLHGRRPLGRQAFRQPPVQHHPYA